MYLNKTSRGLEPSRTGDSFAILWELGRSLYDDALVACDDEREAAFLASARLLSLLEKKGSTEQTADSEVPPAP